jgi:ElaB/YqjD/DUF883 family membrane-anchored ribosome-binding protein
MPFDLASYDPFADDPVDEEEPFDLAEYDPFADDSIEEEEPFDLAEYDPFADEPVIADRYDEFQNVFGEEGAIAQAADRGDIDIGKDDDRPWNFWEGVWTLAKQVPSMFTDIIPLVVYRAERRGEEMTLEDETPIDRLIRKNLQEREAYKKLTPEERKKRWFGFKVPFSNIQVNYELSNAEDALDSVGYSLVNTFAVLAGRALGNVAAAPTGPAYPITSKIFGHALGAAGAYWVSKGATKDEFIEGVRDEFLKENNITSPDQITPEIRAAWREKYEEIESDADWYGIWEAVPETIGNMLMIGIAKLKPKNVMGLTGFSKAVGLIKNDAIRRTGEFVAKKVGVPLAKLVGMWTEESFTEAFTAMKQSEIDFKHGRRDKPLSYVEAFVEVLPHVLLTTTILGPTVGGAVKLFEKATGKAVDEKDPQKLTEVFNKAIEELPREQVIALRDRMLQEAPEHPAIKMIDEVLAKTPEGVPTPEEISPESQVLLRGREAHKKTVVETLEKESPEAVYALGEEYGLTQEEMDNTSIDQVITMVADRISGITAPAIKDQGGGIQELEDAAVRLDKTFKPGQIVEAPTDATRAQAQELSSALGGKTTFYIDKGKSVLAGINGFYDPATGRVFINANAKNPVLRVLGHEVWHRIRSKHGDLYDNVIAVAKNNEELFTSFTKSVNEARKKLGLKELSVEKLTEEYMADYAGELFSKPAFWKALNEQNPTFARKVATSLVKIIEDFRRIIAAKPELKKIKQPFENMDQVEKAMVETFGKAIEREAEKAKKLTAEEAKLEIEVTPEIAKFQKRLDGHASGLRVTKIVDGMATIHYEKDPSVTRTVDVKTPVSTLRAIQNTLVGAYLEKQKAEPKEEVKFSVKEDPVVIPPSLATDWSTGYHSIQDHTDAYAALEHMQALELKVAAYNIAEPQDEFVKHFRDEAEEELDALTDEIRERIAEAYDHWLERHTSGDGWFHQLFDPYDENGYWGQPSEPFKDGRVGVIDWGNWNINVEDEIVDAVNDAPYLPDVSDGLDVAELLDEEGWNSDIGEVIQEVLASSGYDAWKANWGKEMTDAEERIQYQSELLEKAETPGEKVVAINLALNEHHVYGTMSEHAFGLDETDLQILSEMGDNITLDMLLRRNYKPKIKANVGDIKAIDQSGVMFEVQRMEKEHPIKYAAIKMGDKIFKAPVEKTHLGVVADIPRGVIDSTPDDQIIWGFVTKDGKFVDREEAAKLVGLGPHKALTSQEVKFSVQFEEKMVEPDYSDPFVYQQSFPEKTVHEDWNKANSPRWVFEAAGDILREFTKTHPDQFYLNEKIKRVERFVVNSRMNKIHPDDSLEAAVKHEPKKLKKLTAQYRKQPTQTKQQKKAKELILAMLTGKFRKAHKHLGNIKEMTDAEGIMLEVKTPEFKKWFGKSMVVDPFGVPKVLYHGTVAKKDFSIFQAGEHDIGIHFGTSGQANDRINYIQQTAEKIAGQDPEMARPIVERSRIVPAYVKIENPLVLRSDPGLFDIYNLPYALSKTEAFSAEEIEELKEFEYMEERHETDSAAFREAVIKLFKKHGYDGIQYWNTGEIEGQAELIQKIKDATTDTERQELYEERRELEREKATWSWMAFHPEQIKSIWNKKPTEDFDIRMAKKVVKAPKVRPYKELSDAEAEHFRKIRLGIDRVMSMAKKAMPTDVVNDVKDLKGLKVDYSKVLSQLDPVKIMGEKVVGGAFWDEKNDRVVIIANRFDSVKDALGGWLHEQVGHKGLRDLFKDRKIEFNDFLDAVYDAAKDEQLYIETEFLYGPEVLKMTPLEARRYITSEFLAKRAEQLSPGKLKRIYQLFRDFVNKWFEMAFGIRGEQYEGQLDMFFKKEKIVELDDIPVILEAAKRHVYTGAIREMEETQFEDQEYVDFAKIVYEQESRLITWYSNHQDIITKKLGKDAPIFNALLAITSVAGKVEANAVFAVQTYLYLTGRRDKPGGRFPKSQVEPKVKELQEGKGLKALMGDLVKIQEMVRALYLDPKATVNDRWMYRIFFGDPMWTLGEIQAVASGKTKYAAGLKNLASKWNALENITGRHKVNEITKMLSEQTDHTWVPQEAQAAMWSYWKARMEGIPLAQVADYYTSLNKKSPTLKMTPMEYLEQEMAKPGTVEMGQLHKTIKLPDPLYEEVSQLERNYIDYIEKHREPDLSIKEKTELLKDYPVEKALGMGVHFRNTILEKGDFLLASDRDGNVEPSGYSRSDIGSRLAAHTEKNPYEGLVYFYEAGTRPEPQIKTGKRRVYNVNLAKSNIYNSITDPLKFREEVAKELKKEPFASHTNILARMIREAGYDGFLEDSPYGQGRWILMFEKVAVDHVPTHVKVGVSDVVESIEKLPQSVAELTEMLGKRADEFYSRIAPVLGRYPEISEVTYKPAIARFMDATSGKLEIGGIIDMVGPLPAVQAFAAELGIENSQRQVYVMRKEDVSNGRMFKFKVKKDFQTIEEVAEKFKEHGLEEYNITVNREAGSIWVEQFVYSAEDFINDETLEKMGNLYAAIADTGFPGNEEYDINSEILGDDNEKEALKNYKEYLVKYFGKEKGEERYADTTESRKEYRKALRSGRAIQPITEEERDKIEKGKPEEKDISESDLRKIDEFKKTDFKDSDDMMGFISRNFHDKPDPEPDLEIQGYHGSGAIFEEFDTSFIGTGEGAQAFGWGLYFSSIEGIGRHYINTGSGRQVLIGGKDVKDNTLRELLMRTYTDWQTGIKLAGPEWRGELFVSDENRMGVEALGTWLDTNQTMVEHFHNGRKAILQDIKKFGKTEALISQLASYEYTIERMDNQINEAKAIIKDLRDGKEFKAKKTKVLYRVTIHKGKKPSEYTYLDWYKKVPKNIQDKLREPLRKLIDKRVHWVDHQKELNSALNTALIEATGEQLYNFIGKNIFSDKESASKFLLENGVDGIRYPTQSLTQGAPREYYDYFDGKTDLKVPPVLKRVFTTIGINKQAIKEYVDAEIRLIDQAKAEPKNLSPELQQVRWTLKTEKEFADAVPTIRKIKKAIDGGTFKIVETTKFNYVVFDDSAVSIEDRIMLSIQQQGPELSPIGKQYMDAFLSEQTIDDRPVVRSRLRGLLHPWKYIAGKSLATGETIGEVLIRKMQDKYIHLKKLQERLSPRTQLEDKIDVYLAEEIFSGKTTWQLDQFEEKYVKPLLDKMVELDIDPKDLDLYLYARHAEERNNRIDKVNPEFEQKQIPGSGMHTETANAILEKYKKKGLDKKLEGLAKVVDGLNDARLKLLVKAGMITEADYKRISGTYKKYVPLKGKEGEPDFGNSGRGFSIPSTGIQRALGRKSFAQSPLAWTLGGIEETIVKVNKNEVGKAVLGLIREFPDKNLWTIDEITFKQKWDPVSEQVEAVRVPAWAQKDVLHVWEDGKRRNVKIKDPLLEKALLNIGVEKSNAVVGALAKFNRYLAMVNTSLNPEFVLSNFIRDIQTAGINLSADQSSALMKKVMKDVPKALRHAYRGYRGKPGIGDWGKWFKLYRSQGGSIGFFGLRGIGDRTKVIETMIKRAEKGVLPAAQRGITELGGFISDLNAAVENAVRLASFKNAVQAGMSIKRAASLSKNLTVNFNRKGELGQLMNSFYLFYNAGIQGTARVLKVMASKKGRLIGAGIAATAFMLTEMNRMIAGDDEEDGRNYYDKIPNYVKERSIILMIPGTKGDYIRFPLPYGYNIFWVTGEQTNSALHSGKPVQGAINIVNAAVDAFNPMGGDSSLIRTLSPTLTDIPLDLYMNQNFAGYPIKPEQSQFGLPKPQSWLYWKSVSPISKYAAQLVNRLTGGNPIRPGKIDISPEVLDYLANTFTGAMGAFINRSINLPINLLTGKERPIHKTPFQRVFMGEQTEFYTGGEYRKVSEEITRRIEEKEEGLPPLAHELSPELMSRYKATEKNLRSLRKRIKSIENSQLSAKRKNELVEKTYDQISERQKDLIKRFDEEVGGNPWELIDVLNLRKAKQLTK